MRAFLFTTALVGLATTALAADLPSRRAPAPYMPVAPVFTWTGFYAGVTVGGGTQSTSTRFSGLNAAGVAALTGGLTPVTNRTDGDGVLGGGQIGYNFQFGSIVAGLEADAVYTDFDSKRTVGGNGGFATAFRSNLTYLGTVRGRVGYAFDRVMVYGTGGFAYGDAYNRENLFLPATGNTLAFGSRSDTQTGWAAGAGIEYALATDSFLNVFSSSGVTVKAEYLHFDLGRQSHSVATSVGPVIGSRTRTDGDLGRVGLNYKFNMF